MDRLDNLKQEQELTCDMYGRYLIEVDGVDPYMVEQLVAGLKGVYTKERLRLMAVELSFGVTPLEMVEFDR